MSSRTPRGGMVRALVATGTLVLTLFAPSRAGGAARHVFTETEFLPSDFDITDLQFNAGGHSTMTQVASGGESGAYGSIQLFLNQADANPPAVYSVFIKRSAVYDPATEGAITTIDWDDYAKQEVGTNAGHRTGPAFEQNGVLYVAELSSSPVFTPEPVWTLKSRHGLTVNDFAITNTVTRPDFSATAAPLRFGFFRATSGLPFQPAAGGPVVGIDSWRIEVNAPQPLNVFDEIRAETDVVGSPVSGPGTTDPQAQFRAPLFVSDRVDAVSSGLATTGATATSSARASPSGGLGSISAARGGTPSPVTGTAFTTTARSSWRRKFVVQSTGDVSAADLTFANFAEGSLDLRDTVVDNPAAPAGDQAVARVELKILLHRVTGTTTVFSARADLDFATSGGPPRLTRVGSAAFQDAFSFPTPAPGVPTVVMSYSDFAAATATVDVGEEIAVENVLSTSATADVAAAGWRVTSDFFDTYRTDVSTATPGASLVEVFAEPTGAASGIVVRGRERVQVKRLAPLRKDVEWDVFVSDAEWFAEGDDGVSTRGVAALKGKSGRVFRLTADEVSVAEILDRIADDVRDAGGDSLTFERGSTAPVTATWAFNRKRTKVKLALKLPILTTAAGGVRKGTWRIALAGTTVRSD